MSESGLRVFDGTEVRNLAENEREPLRSPGRTLFFISMGSAVKLLGIPKCPTFYSLECAVSTVGCSLNPTGIYGRLIWP